MRVSWLMPIFTVVAYCTRLSGVEIQSILVSGSQAPGAPVGVTFSDFQAVVTNMQGDVSLRGVLSNGGRGIWSTSGGVLEAIGISGAPAPVMPTASYSFLLLGGLSDSGETGFTGLLNSPFNSSAVFSGTPGNVQKVARSGERPPGFEFGSYFTSQFSGPASNSGIIASPTFNASGHCAFYATVYDSSTFSERFGIWTNRSGTVSPIALTEMQAPGFPADSTIASIADTNWVPRMNDHGGIAFSTSVIPFGSGQPVGAVYSELNGGYSLVARTGDSVPGASPTTTFLGLRDPGINNFDHIAFGAFLGGPDVTGSNSSGIWSNSGGTLHKVARSGDAAPGTTPGTVFSSFDSRTLINGADQTLVSARVSGLGVDSTRDSGLWLERGGTLEMVYQEGMQAPGMAPGVVLRESATVGYGYAMNGMGHVVFRHGLVGPGGASAGEAIFASSGSGNLDLVLRTGQSIEVLPGVVKTLSFFLFTSFSGGDDGGGQFGDAGHFAVAVGYSDGTRGILIAEIPEPSTLAIVSVFVIFGMRKQRFS